MPQASTTRRPRIGDLVEIRTPAGLGYVQYVARDAILGPQVRVLPGVFVERPDLAALALQKALYYVHFLLGPALSRGLVTLVGHERVPEYVGVEGQAFRLQAIWNPSMLAERMAQGWRPA